MAAYTGFGSAGDYFAALVKAPKIIAHRAFLTKSFQQQDEDRLHVGEMKRVLGECELLILDVQRSDDCSSACASCGSHAASDGALHRHWEPSTSVQQPSVV